MKINNAYKEILEIIGKYQEICVYDFKDMELKAKKHLFGVELKEKYNFNIKPKDIYSLDYNKFGSYMSISKCGEKYRRTISWSDDGKQPEDEMLLSIGFSTGAYIFGEDYPTELFQEFFQELKSYNPKYTDTTNKNLYFSMDNAGKIFNEFQNILKKYYEKNKVDLKKRKRKKLEVELEKLKE